MVGELRTPYFEDEWLTILEGDCREVLRGLPAESVNCVITSPPYFGLRDYGITPSVWGGNGHEHEWGAPKLVTVGRNDTDRETPGGRGGSFRGGPREAESGSDCSCGAWSGVLGLEPTPELYVAHMVEVFREVRRVLRKDGTVWLNLGDSYNAYNGGAGPGSLLSKTQTEQRPRLETGFGLQVKSLKPKDRIMIPAHVALALQTDGWWLRDEIIWAKPNPMPSSVTDRTTPAHEMVYLLTKSARYWYDAAAIREPDLGTDHWRAVLDGQPSLEPSGGMLGPHTGLRTIEGRNGLGANRRSVWTVATQPYPEAHFATFPEALVEPMVKAGCPEGGTVLDPFAGSGTVGLVAQRLSRRAVLVDLNAEYLRQCLTRNQAIPLGLLTEAGFEERISPAGVRSISLATPTCFLSLQMAEPDERSGSERNGFFGRGVGGS